MSRKENEHDALRNVLSYIAIADIVVVGTFLLVADLSGIGAKTERVSPNTREGRITPVPTPTPRPAPFIPIHW